MGHVRPEVVTPVRERFIERWASRRLGRLDHERRVRGLAVALLGVLADRHRLASADRRLLRYAALLHDVGRSVEDKRHPQIGAAMIASARFLPVTEPERRALVYLTRYHRGAVPAAGFDAVLRPGDSHRATRTVLAILRAADALDGRQHRPPRVTFERKRDKLKIHVLLADDTPRARKFFSRRKKFRLLEELTGVKVSLDVRAAADAVVV